MTDPVEVAAVAIFETYSRRPDAVRRWLTTPDEVREQFRAEARAAIQALRDGGFSVEHKGSDHG